MARGTLADDIARMQKAGVTMVGIGDPVDVAVAGIDAVTGERVVESVRLGEFDWALVLER